MNPRLRYYITGIVGISIGLLIIFGYILIWMMYEPRSENETCIEEKVVCYHINIVSTGKITVITRSYGNCSDINFNHVEKQCIKWQENK